jgi:hypothetical protein
MLTLEEAIKHCEEVAERLEGKDGYAYTDSTCDECAKEHRQLAEWLKELKALKQNMERQIKGAEEEIEDEYKKTPLDIEKIRTIQIYKECLKDVLYNEMDGVAEPYKADRR